MLLLTTFSELDENRTRALNIKHSFVGKFPGDNDYTFFVSPSGETRVEWTPLPEIWEED